jgi:ComF family protein
MSKLLQSLSQLVFPHLCVCCDGFLSHQETHICTLCSYTLPKFETFQMMDNPLARKFWGRVKLEYATAYLQFKSDGSVRKVLHQLKYKGNKDLGIEMGEAMGTQFSKISQLSDVDIILPIPLHPKRERTRGYNQSDILAQGMSKSLQKKVYYDALARVKYNSTQTKKKRYERFINSQEIFRVVKPDLLAHKHILLLDDVITTGATIEACGNALLEVEGLRLSVASLAAAT